MDQNFTGLIPDPRSPEEKARDYKHEEIATAVPLNWNRDISGAPQYSQRDQDGSGSCVGQGNAKAIEILEKEVISAHPIYRRRSNYPDEGMWLQEAGRIVHKPADDKDLPNHGTTTEALDPSQRMNEAQMNADLTVATPIMEPVYITIQDPTDIEKIATAIELYKHCVLTISGAIQYYASYEKPEIGPDPTRKDFAHCICGKYYFTDENGKRCILADESWGPNNIRQRILTEDYLKNNATGAMYYVPAGAAVQKPSYHFTKPLGWNLQNDADVIALQDCLKYEGFFSTGVGSTGNFLTITAHAVQKWQIAHGITDFQGVTDMTKIRIGPKSLALLNQLYAQG